MTELEQEEVFNILSRTLRDAISSAPSTKNRVEIYERALIREKIMEWTVGKTSKDRLDKFPQIEYRWQEFDKLN